jgi:mRNA interferase YafQ
MTKPPSSKRADPPRSAEFTKRFLKDWERLNRSGRFDMVRLKEVVLLLIANDGPLDPQWLDHALKGNWANHRECHVGGDFLVVYRIEEDTVVFVRTGTHAELFE